MGVCLRTNGFAGKRLATAGFVAGLVCQSALATADVAPPADGKAPAAPESPAAAKEQSKAFDFSVVSQGGVSLGAWQAGFALVLTTWVRDFKRRQTLDPVHTGFSTVTGASAGAVNGLAIALESCRKDTYRTEREGALAVERLVLGDPEQSLFFRVWVDALGLFGRGGNPGLLPADGEGSSLALFDDRAITEVAMRQATLDMNDRDAYVQGCAVNLGFAVTHLDAVSRAIHVDIEGTPILERASARRKFALELVPSAAGPIATNICPHKNDAPFYANLGHQEQVPDSLLREGIRASGAFPIAFPPVPLPYLDRGIDERGVQSHRSRFIDGGTFDNTPVGLAIDLNKWRFVPNSGRSTTQCVGELHTALRPEKIIEADLTQKYYFLDPGVTQWAIERSKGNHLKDEVRRDDGDDILQTVGDFVAAFASSSLDAEFSDNTRTNSFLRREGAPGAAKGVNVPIRYMPIAGEQFAHFLGFAERDFRVFDFFVGMADATRFIFDQEKLLRAGKTQSAERVRAAFDAQSPKYQCLNAYYDTFLVGKRADQPVTQFSDAALVEACSWTGNLGGAERAAVPNGAAAPSAATAESSPSTSGLAFEWSPYGQRRVLHPRVLSVTPDSDVSGRNFGALLLAMHNYRLWFVRKGLNSDQSLKVFFRALSGDTLRGEFDVNECGDEPLRQRRERGPAFTFVDLPEHQYGFRGMNGCAAMGAMRDIADVLVKRLSERQTDMGTKTLLRLVRRPALDKVFEVKLWPRWTWGVGFGRGPETFIGKTLHKVARLDGGLRLFKLTSGFQPEGIDESRWASDIYARIMLQDLWSYSIIDQDLFVGGTLGATLAHPGYYWGPTLGLRLSLFDRLSVGYEQRFLWATEHAKTHWSEGNAFFSWQLFPDW